MLVLFMFIVTQETVFFQFCLYPGLFSSWKSWYYLSTDINVSNTEKDLKKFFLLFSFLFSVIFIPLFNFYTHSRSVILNKKIRGEMFLNIWLFRVTCYCYCVVNAPSFSTHYSISYQQNSTNRRNKYKVVRYQPFIFGGFLNIFDIQIYIKTNWYNVIIIHNLPFSLRKGFEVNICK